MKFNRMILVACFLAAGIASIASAAVIDFETLHGPSTFGAPNQHIDIIFKPPDGVVQFDGGVILTKTTDLPVDQTTVYGTYSGFNTNPITVTFPSAVNNFFLDVLNGNTVDVTYRLMDNTGLSRYFTLPPNLSSGQAKIGFTASGNVVTITALTPPGGFFPPSSAPHPAPPPLPASVSPLPPAPPLPNRLPCCSWPPDSPVWLSRRGASAPAARTT